MYVLLYYTFEPKQHDKLKLIKHIDNGIIIITVIYSMFGMRSCTYGKMVYITQTQPTKFK